MRPHAPRRVLILAVGAVAAAGCFKGSGQSLPGAVTPDTHSWFPITAASEHAIGRVMSDGTTMSCNSCHAPGNPDFKQWSCVGCHTHEETVTDRLHLGHQAQYMYDSASCYSCHPNGNKIGFSHFGITDNCAACHDVGNPFAALPVAGFVHEDTGGSDCSSCHATTSWQGAGNAPRDSHDPARDLMVPALVPTYAGTSIVDLAPETETLPQRMNHATTAVDPNILGTCTNCHADAASGIYYPGTLHASLAFLQAPQPTACADCHAATAPTGFVGPTATSPPRSPPSGEMKHDAVAWVAGAPGMSGVVAADCAVCHQPAGQKGGAWSLDALGASPARFHGALAAAGMAQPSSCVDCHANTRPGLLSAAAAPSLPAAVTFDHQAAEALGDCGGCHTSPTSAAGASWAGGKFHAPGQAAPATCLPCHAGERPTSTAGWTSTTYTRSPFDYVGGGTITHGDGQDCATCHTGPGTGAWGGTQNWAGAAFAHSTGSAAGQTCVACHSTQRPTAPVSGFDHSLNGTGDCFACHQATVKAGSFVNYTNPATGTLPGGDWTGGQTYPGDVLASGSDQFVTLTELQLTRGGPGNLITGITSSSETLYNGILHTSAAIDARLSPGPATSPDNTKCWHCHTNTNGTVTAYAGGVYHAALTAYAATPGGAVTPIAQPTSRCNDCHAQMRPTGIVEKAASDLQAMDHGAVFTAAVTIGGVSASGVADLDCSTCHKSPGGAWSDGKFHASIGAAVPKDCSACHYPLMSDAAAADLTNGAYYAMKHRSGQVTFQSCNTCHTSALGHPTTVAVTATLWAPGNFHASLTSQPAACADCHTITRPAANASTASGVQYTLVLGGSATNQTQWMNHGATYVAGKDCATCHASDAKASGAIWSKTDLFHAKVASVTTCNECHGLSNGGGSAAGTNNNLPVGLTNSSTSTSAAADATTGIAAGTLDQMSHADVNVTAHECNFCHTQVGPSTSPSAQGQEWAQARFHASFNGTNPLVTNGTTGRCSNCHLNVKPGASFTAQSHAAYTNTAGTTDCDSCHSWPGAGGAAAPNWLGAMGGVPQLISVGGFTIPKPPATSAGTTQTGIANLPHPTAGAQACTTCHSSGGGGTQAIGYDHASTLANANCDACHEAGSNLVSPAWNGSTTQAAGAGDTRPFTIGSLTAKKGGSSCTVTFANHFYPADCSKCHVEPTGTVQGTTGSAYTSAWSFNHNESNMRGLCGDCHGPCPGD